MQSSWSKPRSPVSESARLKRKKNSGGLSNRRRSPSGSADIDRESLRVDGCFSQYLILTLAPRAVARPLRHLVACRHHQSRFAALVHAAEPAGVKSPPAFLFFVEVSILPDLHWLATARARIAIAGDDDVFLSRPLAPSSTSHHLTSQKKLSARNMRAVARPSNLDSEFRWYVAVGWHVAINMRPLISRQMQISTKTGVVHVVLSSFYLPQKPRAGTAIPWEMRRLSAAHC